jgi:sugar phosphate isomerase/epimerase
MDIGINLMAEGWREQALVDYLADAQAAGYRLVELSVPVMNVIINGELIPQRVAHIKAALDRFDLRYSVHAPNRTNLAYGRDPEQDYRVLEACVRFAHVIGARTLVYHSGLQALDAAHTGTVPLPDTDALLRGAEREVAALKRLAPLAADLNVIVGMENGDPHLWEYAVLRANGKPPEDLPVYHARLRVPPILAQLDAIDHPNIGMTLDIAHLHIAAHTVGFDYLEAVGQAARWTRHVHVNDNFGKLDDAYPGEGDKLPHGEGDLHLPPGWGSIPYADVFALLPDYTGDVIIELKPSYIEHLGEALGNFRAVFE